MLIKWSVLEYVAGWLQRPLSWVSQSVQRLRSAVSTPIASLRGLTAWRPSWPSFSVPSLPSWVPTWGSVVMSTGAWWVKPLLIMIAIIAAFGGGVVVEAERTQGRILAAQETTRKAMEIEKNEAIAALTLKITKMADAAIQDARERAEQAAREAIEDEKALQEGVKNATDREALSIGSVDALNAVGGLRNSPDPSPSKPPLPAPRRFNDIFRRAAPNTP